MWALAAKSAVSGSAQIWVSTTKALPSGLARASTEWVERTSVDRSARATDPPGQASGPMANLAARAAVSRLGSVQGAPAWAALLPLQAVPLARPPLRKVRLAVQLPGRDRQQVAPPRQVPPQRQVSPRQVPTQRQVFVRPGECGKLSPCHAFFCPPKLAATNLGKVGATPCSLWRH